MLLTDKVKNAVENILYPANPRCVFCNRVLMFDTDMLCSKCRRLLTLIGENTCIKCGDNLDVKSDKQLCGRCRESQFSFEGGVSVYVYDDVSKNMILNFKYANNPYGAHCCGLALAEKALKQSWFSEIDIITCVPASNETFKKRGYNQSELIANAFKEKCDIIINNNIMIKKIDLKDQIGLNIQERQENMKNAFEPVHPESILGKTLLIVDDVMTTGATMNACSDVLIKAGAAKVYSATVASAFINKNIIK